MDQVFASFLDIAAQATSRDHLFDRPRHRLFHRILETRQFPRPHPGRSARNRRSAPVTTANALLAQLKRMVDWQASLGINRFVISPDVPLRHIASWPHYELFSDYAARLSYVLSQGRHKAQAAVLYPTMTAKTERQPGAGLVRRLMMSYFALYCACLPLDHIDLDAVTKEQHYAEAEVIDDRLWIADANYELLIIPPTTCLGHAASERNSRVRGRRRQADREYVLLPTADSEGDKDEAVNDVFGENIRQGPRRAVEKVIRGPDRFVNCHATQSESGAYLVQSTAPTDILDHLETSFPRPYTRMSPYGCAARSAAIYSAPIAR